MKNWVLILLLSILPWFGYANSSDSPALDTHLTIMEVTSKSGLKLYRGFDGRKTFHRYLFPHWGEKVTKLAERGNRTRVRVCEDAEQTQCSEGWVSSRHLKVHSTEPLTSQQKSLGTQAEALKGVIPNLKEGEKPTFDQTLNPPEKNTAPRSIGENLAKSDPVEEALRTDNKIQCKGRIQSKKSGLAIRTLKAKSDGTPTMGDNVHCWLNKGVNLCAISENYRPGRNNWVWAFISPSEYKNLSPACKGGLLKDNPNAATNGHMISLATNPNYIQDVSNYENIEEDPNPPNVSSFCFDCMETKTDIDKTEENVNALGADITRIADALTEQSKPETSDLSISDQGFTYPINPYQAYVTSPFAQVRRLAIYGQKTKRHTGTDFGTHGQIIPVKAAKAGKVIRAYQRACPESKVSSDFQCGGEYGNHVVILHDDGRTTKYGHMYHNCKHRVQLGQRVSTGQNIGCVGSSGSSTGRHLDFKVVENGKYIDPRNVLGDLIDAYYTKSSKPQHLARMKEMKRKGEL